MPTASARGCAAAKGRRFPPAAQPISSTRAGTPRGPQTEDMCDRGQVARRRLWERIRVVRHRRSRRATDPPNRDSCPLPVTSCRDGHRCGATRRIIDHSTTVPCEAPMCHAMVVRRSSRRVFSRSRRCSPPPVKGRPAPARAAGIRGTSPRSDRRSPSRCRRANAARMATLNAPTIKAMRDACVRGGRCRRTGLGRVCAAPPQSHSAPVSRAEGQGHPDSGPWPFTVDEGVLKCHPPNWVTFRAGEEEYALTDDARWLGHYEDVKAVLAPDYVEIGTERQPVPVEPNRRMVDRGRELCPANH